MNKQNDLFDLPAPEVEDGKVCIKCNVMQPHENFPIANSGNYRRTECASCTSKISKHLRMLRKQNPHPENGYKCPICNRGQENLTRAGKNSPFVLDHCHDTGDYRGWLCDHCNRGLGAFGDDIERLKKAIDYLSSVT